MYKVHGYCDDEMVLKCRMAHLPRLGDTVRLAGERYAKITEVVWCLDEPNDEGQRVNLRMATDAGCHTGGGRGER